MNFMRQIVPRFTTTDELTLEAYLALLDRVGPSVVVAHSQAGLFGWRAAQERPDKVRALVLVEPAAVGDPAKVAALRNIPVLMVYGDYIAQDSRWPTIRANGVRFAEAVRAAGGSVDVVDLPERGIRGNSHMLMMDRNGDQAAGVIQEWLASKGLYR
jgi:pimeloyl-ACP methyl ester carboxylesterase